MKRYKYLIVGGGMAADAAVKGIREEDTDGDIAVIGAEPDPPYKRPPLSKDLWIDDDASEEDIWCDTKKNDAEMILRKRVDNIDQGNKTVKDTEGVEYGYERLLLATGGSPRRLPGDPPRVLYYRTVADYRKLRELAEQHEDFVVLGGGFIGTEIAAALADNGRNVTMVFPEAGVGAQMVPPEFSRELTRMFEKKGIAIRGGRKPSVVENGGEDVEVQIENGTTVTGRAIVAGIGIVPNDGLAREAGLEVDDGILVDEQLRTSDPDIFAAGDVARFYNPLLDRRIRVEHEDNALTAGHLAGRNMAGAAETYDHLPSFYSDLFDHGYEAIGDTSARLKMVSTVEKPSGKGCIFYLEEERVRGVLMWNLFGKVDAARELLSAPGKTTMDQLQAWVCRQESDD